MLKYGYSDMRSSYDDQLDLTLRKQFLHRLIEQVRQTKQRGLFRSAIIAAKDIKTLDELRQQVQSHLRHKGKTSAQRKLERAAKKLERSQNTGTLPPAYHLKSELNRILGKGEPKPKKRKFRNKHDRKLRPDEVAAAHKIIADYDAKLASMKQGYTACAMGNIRIVGTNGRVRKAA